MLVDDGALEVFVLEYRHPFGPVESILACLAAVFKPGVLMKLMETRPVLARRYFEHSGRISAEREIRIEP